MKFYQVLPTVRTFLSMLTLAGLVVPQLANAHPTPDRAHQQQPRRNALAQPLPNVKAERLAQSVDLPNIPRYSGKAVFLEGFRVYDRCGEQIGMTFEAKETSDQIIQWYRDSLKEYSWNVLKDSEPNVLSALKDGNTFAMRVVETHVPGYRSRLLLSFQHGR